MLNDSLPLRTFKSLLTRAGAISPIGALTLAQASVNYIQLGRWMRDQGYSFDWRVPTKEHVWDRMAKKIQDQETLYLEFGVAGGRSMTWWSKHLKNPLSFLYGFDSFEGLPETSPPWQKGQFNRSGQVPQIDDPRVRFFKGWFDQALPNVHLPEHQALVINMDADLYSSTLYVLRWLLRHLKPETLLYFDNMHAPNHEPRALADFCTESGLRLRAFCADVTLSCVCFVVVGLP
jgi:hypothetical protein